MKNKSRFPRRLLLSLTVLSISVLAFRYLHPPDRLSRVGTAETGQRYDVRVLRDSWGVPHIFGVTDADVAYGLGYAHAEDDFDTIQKSLLAARGELARFYGKKMAPNDYMVQLLRIWDLVNARYDRDLSPEVRAVCEAYAAGLNRYARLHPDKVLPGVLPFTGKDVVAGFVHKVPLFFGLHETLKELFEPERKHPVSKRHLAAGGLNPLNFPRIYGSNAFAVSPRRSAHGETFLAVNSHQPWEGPVTWYEVHLHSEEGWDMVGGVFPGSPVVMHGHNRNLGWAHTVNKPDLIDVYVLETNPENPNQYRFDGRWLDLEVRTAPIKVKLLGGVTWTVNKEVLWSVYGPVVRRPHGTYAIRYVGMDEVRYVEQWYRMNKARDFSEWLSAMHMQAIPKFNTIYADREGNIYYVYNARLPLRAAGYDWQAYLPGNTSETLWREVLDYDKLPQVLNPASGFVQNCNSTPFQTTIGPENPRPEAYPPMFGIENTMTNRAYRALELFGADTSITEEEFSRYKFDMAYSPRSEVAACVRKILSFPFPDDPLARTAYDVLRKWDLRTNPENTSAALAILTLQSLLHGREIERDPAQLVAGLIETARRLKERFGRVDVPWAQVNRLIRGQVDYGLGGGPDVLHAVYGKEMKDGRLRGFVGDSYVLLVTWDAQGRVHSRSIHQYGSATLDATSPHYADQAELFVRRQLKPVWLDVRDIRAHLEREYRPGEERPVPQ